MFLEEEEDGERDVPLAVRPAPLAKRRAGLLAFFLGLSCLETLKESTTTVSGTQRGFKPLALSPLATLRLLQPPSTSFPVHPPFLRLDLSKRPPPADLSYTRY